MCRYFIISFYVAAMLPDANHQFVVKIITLREWCSEGVALCFSLCLFHCGFDIFFFPFIVAQLNYCLNFEIPIAETAIKINMTER